MTESSKAPLRAIALASFLDDGYPSYGRPSSVKDEIPFGSVLQHTQHNIGNINVFHIWCCDECCSLNYSVLLLNYITNSIQYWNDLFYICDLKHILSF